MHKDLKLIVEKHSDGYVAYPLGMKVVVVDAGEIRSRSRGRRYVCDYLSH